MAPQETKPHDIDCGLQHRPLASAKLISEQDQDEALARAAGFMRIDCAPDPLPVTMPTFALKDLRAAIPKHCFQRPLTTSLYYLAKDIAIIMVLLALAVKFHGSQTSIVAQLIFWPLYWLAQGTVLAGLWVLGHECGHDAFSNYPWLNDAIGMVIHSSLLTPYYSWKITHRHHHSNIGSMEHDEVFIPMTRSAYTSWLEAVEENLEDAPLYNLARITMMLVIGWMPGYLVFNATGPAKYQGQRRSHFDPYAVLYTDRERKLIAISDTSVGVALAALGVATYQCSFAFVAKMVLAPYVVLNAYMVLITMLQHTDTFVPRFRNEGWTWLHGALCTVDRDFGNFLNTALHHMPDTHVCHHIFSKIPFYHAVEATEAIRPILGRYYLSDSTPITKALWRCYTHCKFVEDDGNVVFCKKSL